jgi:hypothetical protein
MRSLLLASAVLAFATSAYANNWPNTWDDIPGTGPLYNMKPSTPQYMPQPPQTQFLPLTQQQHTQCRSHQFGNSWTTDCD